MSEINRKLELEKQVLLISILTDDIIEIWKIKDFKQLAIYANRMIDHAYKLKEIVLKEGVDLMNNKYPRPWFLTEIEFHGAYKSIIEIHDSSNKPLIEFTIAEKDMAELVIKCVNEHDNLIAEVERLKKENKQIKEALKSCNPYDISPNGVGISCLFCNEYSYNHKPDCEYIKLIGGNENE